jgi:hypothetical protein
MSERLVLIGCLGGILLSLCVAPAAAQGPTASPAVRDGSHDFDFSPGTWHTHVKRILDPLEGGTHMIELDGTVTTRKVWGGRAWLEEIEADGPNGHWEGMTLFLYNPKSGQWSQSYAGSDDGQISATVGSFHDGVGELYATETYHGRQVLVRGVWSGITADAHDYTISYSDDGGRSWAPVFIAHKSRIK